MLKVFWARLLNKGLKMSFAKIKNLLSRSNLKKCHGEIKLVGVRNWFVIILKRNEFSHKLDLNKYYPDLKRLNRDRTRAHNIDHLLSDHKTL
jgi:hypothetical protein